MYVMLSQYITHVLVLLAHGRQSCIYTSLCMWDNGMSVADVSYAVVLEAITNKLFERLLLLLEAKVCMCYIRISSFLLCLSQPFSLPSSSFFFLLLSLPFIKYMCIVIYLSMVYVIH